MIPSIKPVIAIFAFFSFLFSQHLNAQTDNDDFKYLGGYPFGPHRQIHRATMESMYVRSESTDSLMTPVRFGSDIFDNNWFVLATAGAHTFQGDFSRTGNIMGTISPDFSVGFGKWISPSFAFKLECIRSKSQGYTEYLDGHYGVGPVLYNKNESPYRRTEMSWWDVSGSVIVNFTRLFFGYEGYYSPKRMNQLMMALGFGIVHHLGSEAYPDSDNEMAAHFEMQYSRFLTRAKNLSLDLKLRNIIYQNDIAGAYGNTSHNFDFNLGLDLGITYLFGTDKKHRESTAQIYRRDFRERDVDAHRIHVDTMMTRGNGGGPRTLTFYVFYPNNYSGINDAPISADSEVNAIEYLLGGIFTQKKYDDATAIAKIISSESSTIRQPYSNIPTEPANNYFAINCVQRGYEMSSNEAMSLSMAPSDMYRFYSQAGYFYAPIWDGFHEWHYRVDEDTIEQPRNYGSRYIENETYGLNAHTGIPILMETMETETGDCLVSFADVYAALNGNKGFISGYTNPRTVEMIRDVFRNGVITLIEVHGVATSQDTYSGTVPGQTGLERNISLADNRANTVMSWLKGTDTFSGTKSIVYIDNGFIRPSHKINITDTRGLTSKLNQCVKVRIQVIY